MNHHINGTMDCPLCEEKLILTHPVLQDWFKTKVKPSFPDCHISWSYRDKLNQNQAVAMGKSKLPFPMSAHNKSDDNGNPCSLALDLFELASNGMACWPWLYFKQIYDKCQIEGMTWGGIWKSIGDSDHYQIEIV